MRNVKLLVDTTKVGVLSLVIALALPDLAGVAAAADDVSAVMTTVVGQANPVPRILSAACYMIGLLLMISGALSLKKHAENPASEPMGKGLSRLVIGGAIISLPGLSGVIANSIGVSGGAEVGYQPLPTPAFGG